MLNVLSVDDLQASAQVVAITGLVSGSLHQFLLASFWWFLGSLHWLLLSLLLFVWSLTNY